MGGGDGNALGDGLGADNGQQQGLAPVAVVHLVARFQRLVAVKGDEPRFLRLTDRFRHRFPLGFRPVQKGLVPFAVVVRLADGRVVQHLPGFLGLVTQLRRQLFRRAFFFCHDMSSYFLMMQIQYYGIW